MKRIMLFAVLVAATLARAEALPDSEINLLRTGKVEPAVIHG